MYLIKTFNGNVLNNNTNLRATALNFGTAASADLAFIEIANSDPAYAGVFKGIARNLAIGLRITDYANRVTLEGQIRAWLRRGTSGLLVVTLDDGAEYQVTAVVQSLVPDSKVPGMFIAILQAAESTWKRVTAETDSWNADATHLTKTITVGGTEETRLIVSLSTGGTVINGWKYQYLYQLTGKMGVNYGVRPWCIALDTAALVTAGKLQAGCDDMRVMVNGVEVKRWIADPNTTTTHLWFTVNQPAGVELKLLTPIASSGTIGEIYFTKTADTVAALNKLPNEFTLVHGTEWLQCRVKDTKLYRVGVVKRGALGTNMQAHVLNDVFAWIPNVVYVLAGNSAVSNPATDDATYDDDKPVFDLTQSDNTQWVYTASTLFYDALHPTRPGSWAASLKRTGDQSAIYTYAQNGESGSPAMGALMASWLRLGKWQNETATLIWRLNCPGGIGEVSSTGSKFRSGTLYPATAGLLRSNDGNGWSFVWNESNPITGAAWTAWTHAAAAINATANKWIGFIFGLSLTAAANQLTYNEVLTATVKFVTTNLPTGTLLAQSSSYPLNIKFSNAVGDSLAIAFPTQSGKTFLVDSEVYAVTYDGLNVHGAMALNDESRSVWLRLAPGSNVLTVAPVVPGDDISTLTIALSWYPRRS